MRRWHNPQAVSFAACRPRFVDGNCSGLGFPTFSLPLLAVDGLPLGVQWMGTDGQDGAIAATANWALCMLA